MTSSADDKKQIRQEAETIAKTMNLSVVRLCFQVCVCLSVCACTFNVWVHC